MLDAGAEEVNDLGESFEVVSEATDLVAVRTALQDAGIDYESAETAFLPIVEVELDEDGARKVFRLIEALEDSDDVQNVYANYDVPDEIMEKLDQPPAGRTPVTGRPRAEIRKLTPDDDLETAARPGPAGRSGRSAGRPGTTGWPMCGKRSRGRTWACLTPGGARRGEVPSTWAQWWHGRSLRAAGVANEVVAPEERGRGTGRALMDSAGHRDGVPRATRCPCCTRPPQRSTAASGYELAVSYQVSMPARSLRSLLPPDVPVSPAGPALPMRRAGPDDVGRDRRRHRAGARTPPAARRARLPSTSRYPGG